MNRPWLYCFDPVCLGSGLLYLLNRFLIKPSAIGHIGFFRDYFNDLLCIPIFLPLVLLMHRGMGLRRGDYPPTIVEIAFHLLIWSICFEGIAPQLKTLYRTTADPLDLAAYGAGALIGGLVWGSFRGARSACESRVGIAHQRAVGDAHPTVQSL